MTDHRPDPKLNPEALRTTSSPISSKSDANFGHIADWHRQCSESHTKCRDFPNLVAPDGQLPSRLLDVSNDKVRLECNVKDLPPGLAFTTLSHMWGPDPSLCPQLLSTTIDAYSTDIPLTDLPGKYVNAVRITRALGFRYVWIDSLCIIQDSKEDWEREAVKMAAVYGRSSCNISYTFPPAAEAEGKHLRDPRVFLPCQVTLSQEGRRPSRGLSGSLIIQHLHGHIRPSWSPTVYKRVWPLLSRGWVFQERLLCPRTVYYGQDRLLWECCEGISDEFYGPLTTVPGSKMHFQRVITGIAESLRTAALEPDPAPAPTPQPPRGNATLGGDTDASTGERQWGPLVRDYRSADLFKETDRGIAFAGIARAMQARGAVTYLAGIWKELVEYDLLWSVAPVPVPAERYHAQRAASSPAPSWSWFSVPTVAMQMGGDILDFPFRSTMLTNRARTTARATVVEFHHPKMDGDGKGLENALLHDFAGMTLTLRAKRVPCGFEWWDAFKMLYVLPRGDIQWVLGANKNWVGGKTQEWVSPRVLKYAHDDPLLAFGEMPPDADRACMVLTVAQAWHVDGQKKAHAFKGDGEEVPEGWKTVHQYAGIVVVPAEREGAWKRIGSFMFDDIIAGKIVTPFDGEGVVDEDWVLV